MYANLIVNYESDYLLLIINMNCDPRYFAHMLMVVRFSYRHPSGKWRLWDWDSSQGVSVLLVLLMQI